MKAKWISIGLCCAFVLAVACSEDEIREIIDEHTPGIPAELTGLEGCLFDNLARTISVHQVVGDFIAALEMENLPPGVERQGESDNFTIDLTVDLDEDGIDETAIEGLAAFTDNQEPGGSFSVGRTATINVTFSGSPGGRALLGTLFADFERAGVSSYRISQGSGSISGEPTCTFGWSLGGDMSLEVTDTNLPQVQTNIPGTGVSLVGEINIELLIQVGDLPDVLALVVFPADSTEVEFRNIRDLDEDPLTDDFAIDLALIYGDA